MTLPPQACISVYSMCCLLFAPVLMSKQQNSDTT